MYYFRYVDVIVDIGNSNIVIGLYTADGSLIHSWRLETRPDTPVNWHKNELVNRLLEAGIDKDHCKLVVVSSVVPSLAAPFEAFLRSLFARAQLIAIGPETYEFIELEILRPTQIGSDLVANAYGALKKYERNCLIVDFGTALTCVAAGIDYRIHGVSIAPGIKTAIQALHSNTARLPEVPLVVPEQVGGKSTTHAIQSGILIGYAGLVKELVSRYREEWSADAYVVGTGGLVSLYTNTVGLIDHTDPTLTLDGLRLIGHSVLSSH